MGRLYIYLPFVPWKSTINVGKYTVRSHGSCDGTDGCPGLLSESFADWEPADPSGENTNSLVRKKAEGNPFFSARIFEMCFLFFLCFFWECWTIICLFFLRISLGVYYIRTIINNPNKFPDFLCSVSFLIFIVCFVSTKNRIGIYWGFSFQPSETDSVDWGSPTSSSLMIHGDSLARILMIT